MDDYNADTKYGKFFFRDMRPAPSHRNFLAFLDYPSSPSSPSPVSTSYTSIAFSLPAQKLLRNTWLQAATVQSSLKDIKRAAVRRPDLLTAGMDFIIANPTVRPFPSFSATEDAIALRTAMKGLGTDEDAIIEILTHRSNAQRQEIAKIFNQEYGRDLIKDLKSELGGKFEDVIVGLMYTPIDYLAKQLHKAMEGLGTDEAALVEILCTKNNREIKEIVEAYERMYDRPLAEHLCSETSGDLRRLLTFMVTEVRSLNVDRAAAQEEAQALVDAGELKLGTDEEVFNRILTHESIPQLKLIFEEYKQISGRTIEQSLQDEMSGELLDGLMAIVECIQSPACFFAKRLHKAMAGAGTDDSTLIRIIVSRCEIDLGNIKKEYEKLYDKTLESVVKNETSGDYKHALVALIGGP